MLSAGIVGLPNVGKSTLFNAITNSQVEASNYPFATIEPNVGIVEVKDQRLMKLAGLITPEKIIFATFKFVDIAGLVKGASSGEGLGNKFLSNIREVDCICHVVRCFDDTNITHVSSHVNPINDLEVINLELIIADLETVENRIAKISHKAKSGHDKEANEELEFCKRLKAVLSANEFASTLEMTDKEKNFVKSYNLLTNKPMIYIANIAEEHIGNPMDSQHYATLKKYLDEKQATVIPISAKIECELSQLSDTDKVEIMQALNFNQGSGLDHIIRSAYQILNQCTYFTFGKKETRAWTFLKGYKAPQCAGIIHSDFERGFIKAEVVSCDDLLSYGSEAKAKEAGKVRLEGKDYVMQDGDVCNFKFNV